MKAVCDTSVLIALESLGKLHFLKEIFSETVIPEGVYNELKSEKTGFILEDWIIVKKITNIDLYRSLYLKLDEGESETIGEEKRFYSFCDGRDQEVGRKNKFPVI